MNVRDLPAVDRLAARLAAREDLPPPVAVAIARDSIDAARTAILAGEDMDPVAVAERRAAEAGAMRPRRVINATGVLLHTNLGRAPLPEEAIDAGAQAAAHYGNVEFDVVSGRRGRRGRFVERLAATLVDAEDALVVNNNAGALGLAVAALAGPGGAVAVSRGELIEIGGSFRLPELLAATGVRLVEVGTTNRTRGSDMTRVAGEVDVLLKVHPSNYRVEGFTETVGWAEMARLARSVGRPLVADVGSGLLDTRTPWLADGPPSWLQEEPGVRQVVATGADVVVFSGDKLLGGPQAGIAVGTEAAIATMRAHPLARAIRCDGPRFATLGAVLEMYARGRGGEIPFWEMATRSAGSLRRRLEAVAERGEVAGVVVDGESLPGAGSVPGRGIPGPVLRLDAPAEATWRRLLDAPVPVVTTIRDGAVHIDLRAVAPDDDQLVAAALRS